MRGRGARRGRGPCTPDRQGDTRTGAVLNRLVIVDLGQIGSQRIKHELEPQATPESWLAVTAGASRRRPEPIPSELHAVGAG